MSKLEDKIYGILQKQEARYGQVFPFKRQIAEAIARAMPKRKPNNPGYNKAIDDMEKEEK